MANIPGAVTDPSRVRGEAIEFKSGGDTITGYLARPSQPGRYPWHRRHPRSLWLGRAHPRRRPAVRQYRL